MPPAASVLEQLLRDYAVVHEDALSSTAAYSGQRRWVVAVIDPSAGMCNRAMHLASSLLFAVLTGRALLFDWHVQAPRRVVAAQIETIGHSGACNWIFCGQLSPSEATEYFQK